MFVLFLSATFVEVILLYNKYLAGKRCAEAHVGLLINCLLFDDYHLLGDDNHHSHRRGNLKSYMFIVY
jgi:hypothetical protein